MLDILNREISVDDTIAWCNKGTLSIGDVQWVQPRGIVIKYDGRDDYYFTMLTKPEEVVIVRKAT